MNDKIQEQVLQLERFEGSTDGWAVVEAVTPPFLIGESPENRNWECTCGATLAKGLYARQILGVLVKCGACALISRFPDRTPGQPLTGHPILVHSGGPYPLGSVNVADSAAMIIGERTLADYARETGKNVPGIYEPNYPPLVTDLEISTFESIADRLRALLGTGYERLNSAYLRAQATTSRPVGQNRLVELVHFASAVADQQRQSWYKFDLRADLFAEALLVLAVQQRWERHPAWPELRASLISESQHTVLLLTVAAALVDAHNGVGIHRAPTEQGIGSADIWVEPDLTERVDLEVKAPASLRSPTRKLSEPEAIAIIEKCLRRSSRQRKKTASSLLIVGGYHLGDSYDVLVATVRAMLALERRRWRGLAGVIVCDCTFHSSYNAAGKLDTFGPVGRMEMLIHPGYVGDLSLSKKSPPGYTGFTQV